jgi:hypothetical protein
MWCEIDKLTRLTFSSTHSKSSVSSSTVIRSSLFQAVEKLTLITTVPGSIMLQNYEEILRVTLPSIAISVNARY